MNYLSLNSKQVQIIAEGIMKKHYYYAAPNSRNYRKFDLDLGDVALSFVGATNKENLKTVRYLVSEYGEIWPKEWLDKRGMKEWGELWETIYNKQEEKKMTQEKNNEAFEQEKEVLL
jgi:type IV secretion system protein VirB4